MKKNLLILATICTALIFSCKKNSDNNATPAVTAAKSFTNLTFSESHPFFSTDGSMSSPVDSNTAKTVSSTIDFSYIVNWDYSADGFLDAKTRSQHWYWDEYYKSWLSNAQQTKFYLTNVTKAEFDAAATDESKIGTYFSRSTTIIAPHWIFPMGTCIGGRSCDNLAGDSTSADLTACSVFGFKNLTTGKKGLMYMRTDQPQAWPDPILSTSTKVDIIREN